MPAYKNVRRVANHAMFGQMAWPIPNHNAAHRMRYSRHDDPDRMVAATEMDAYARLLVMPRKNREDVVSAIRKAIAIQEPGSKGHENER